jgi:phosphoserine phosphatase RsbU/P
MSTRTADHVVEVLERVPLFQGLQRSDLEQIAQLVKRKDLGAGEFLFREGDAGDRFYVVATGSVEAVRERPLGDHERLAVYRAGDSFGAMALLSDSPRAVSARAVEDARLLSISQGEFTALLGGDSLPVRLMKGMSRSLRGADTGFDGGEGSGGGDALRQFGRLVLHGLEPRTVPHADGFKVAGSAVRDETLRAGSLWDALGTADGRVLLALLDVQGQGLPPAYLIGITRAVLREVAPAEALERLLGRLNAATFENLFEGVDACVEAAVIELAGGRIRWSCARDQPGVVIRADGSTEEAGTHGPPLGILPAFEYEAAALDLRPGDTFLALSEASSGLVQGAVDLVRSRTDAEPAELAQLLTAALGQAQARGAESDVAFVVIRKT